MKKIKSTIFTPEEVEWIIKNHKGINTDDLTEIINKKFNKNITRQQLKGFRSNHSLPSGVDTTFKKGVVSYRPPKGVRNSIKTEFKKGNKPHNTAPIGSEVVKKGYWYRKITENNPPGQSRKDWKLVHHIVWEEHHGKIPPKHRVIFLDGNTSNFDIKNLALISGAEAAVMSKQNLFSNNQEITKTGNLIAKNIIAINKKLK